MSHGLYLAHSYFFKLTGLLEDLGIHGQGLSQNLGLWGSIGDGLQQQWG